MRPFESIERSLGELNFLPLYESASTVSLPSSSIRVTRRAAASQATSRPCWSNNSPFEPPSGSTNDVDAAIRFEPAGTVVADEEERVGCCVPGGAFAGVFDVFDLGGGRAAERLGCASTQSVGTRFVGARRDFDRVPQRSPRPRACVLVAFENNLPIDQHVGNAFAVLEWISVGGTVDNFVRIKNGNVGK